MFFACISKTSISISFLDMGHLFAFHVEQKSRSGMWHVFF